MSKKILLINDMAGIGKVAIPAMLPILSTMGYNISTLPTALVSNTLDYGKFNILDTTDYMRKTLDVWEELNFSHDIISTGFLVSKEQINLVCKYCEKKSKEGSLIFVDPIMGDEGKLYPGVSEEIIAPMKEICAIADVIVPNITEATLLTGKFIGNEFFSKSEIKELLLDLHNLGAKSIVITSANINGSKIVAVYNDKINSITTIPYTEIPVRFVGTGDIFSASLIGKYLSGLSLEAAVSRSMELVEKLIKLNIDKKDKFLGIDIENCLELI